MPIQPGERVSSALVATANRQAILRTAITVLSKAIDTDVPPLHLPFRGDAYARAKAKFAAFVKNMKDWEAEATATSYES